MIILNNMYTGRYISEDGNLGHEAINLVRADDGRFYIWLNSMGICTQNNVDGCTILMVRTIDSTLYKVLAKATNCHLCAGANISRKKGNAGTDDKIQRYEAQKALKITYNNMDPCRDIYHEDDMFATFYTENVYEADGDIYLTNDVNKADPEHRIYYADFSISEAMRAYIKNTHSAYDPLSAFLNLPIWKEPVEMEDRFNASVQRPEFNFFKLIRKDKDELSISNALAYFIQQGNMHNFLENCLGLDGEFLEDHYTLLREKHNIDISFFGEDHFVIIENKIDAYITADKRTKISSQINKAADMYFEVFSDTEKTEKKELLTQFASRFDGEASQLSKYYFYAVAYLLSKGLDIQEVEARIKCFLLVPEYARKQFKQDSTGCFQSDFRLSEKYKLITYKDLHEFFCENSVNSPYFNDFVSALGPLKKEFNNDLEEEMKLRFLQAVGVQ